jgi:CRP-like cAMP-binding protein
MSDAGFLATVPLFEGRPDADLAELARVMRRRAVPAGAAVWRQGDDARELLLVAEGTLASSLHVPGGRVVPMSRARRADVVGEIALLDGGTHTMSVDAVEDTTVLALGRHDFAALLAGQDATTFALKRRLTTMLTARYRNQLHHLADSLGGGAVTPVGDRPAPGELEATGPPDSRYLRRMGTFRDLDGLALWGFLTSGSYIRCPPGRTLIAEGDPATACYLTINGAVEKVLVRRERRIRVGLAGPGRAFGYASLIDGGPSPVTAITRERSLLLVLPEGPFGQLYNGQDAVSRVFVDVLQRELVAMLRETLRPQARLAASV